MTDFLAYIKRHCPILSLSKTSSIKEAITQPITQSINHSTTPLLNQPGGLGFNRRSIRLTTLNQQRAIYQKIVTILNQPYPNFTLPYTEPTIQNWSW
jgi:hypothetical protein